MDEIVEKIAGVGVAMAIRGFYKELFDLKERQKELKASIDQLETDVNDLYVSLESIETDDDNTDDYVSY